MSHSSWEFLGIENEPIKTEPNNSYLQNWCEITYFFSWSNKQLMTIEGKTWSRGTNSRLPFVVNVNLNLSKEISEGADRKSVV